METLTDSLAEQQATISDLESWDDVRQSAIDRLAEQTAVNKGQYNSLRNLVHPTSQLMAERLAAPEQERPITKAPAP